MSTRFLCRVSEEGHLVPLHSERLMRWRGKDRWVSIHEQPGLGLRSNPANAYLWGVVYAEISRATGGDPDSIHYGMKREALRLGILEPQYILLGDKLFEDDPTTRTDVETFSRYVEWVKHVALHDLGGIVIPDAEGA
jgi:hypothetical protein